MVYRHLLICLSLLFGLACSLQAETDEEMIAKVGLDPRLFFSGSFNPEVLPDCQLWLESSKGLKVDEQGRVLAWKSGLDEELELVARGVQSAPQLVKAVVNDRDVVRFSGGDLAHQKGKRFLAKSGFQLPKSEATVVMCIRVRQPRWLSVLWSYGNSNGPKALTLSQAWKKNANFAQLGVSKSTTLKSSSLLDRGFMVVSMRVSAEEQWLELRRNGQRMGLERGPVQLKEEAEFCLGARAVDHMLSADMDVAEVLVYQRAMSEPVLQAVELSLMKKYNLGHRDDVSTLAKSLPMAYYPSKNELEVAFDADSLLVREVLSQGPVKSLDLEGVELQSGLKVCLYEKAFSRRDALPAYKELKVEHEGVSQGLSLSPWADAPDMGFDHMAPRLLQWKGYLKVPKRGLYTFIGRPYGVSRLKLGGHVVVEQKNGHYGPIWQECGGSIHLEAGYHALDFSALVYARAPDLRDDYFLMADPDGELKVLDASLLFHGQSEPASMPSIRLGKTSNQLPSSVEQKNVGLELYRLDLTEGNMVLVHRDQLDLNTSYRGQDLFQLPSLRDGLYHLQYRFRGAVIPSWRTFVVRSFPWKDCTYGVDERVYEPFEPVRVNKEQVEVVDRKYRFNALGLLEQVWSKGRELLARPMDLVVITSDGKRLTWTLGKLKGAVVRDDLAEFSADAVNDVFELKAGMKVEEDGCIEVNLDLAPRFEGLEIQEMFLEIPYKDAEAPMFHYNGNDSMRHNYAGLTPRGGRIVWDMSAGWVPCTYRVEPGPEDGLLWDSTQVRHWRRGNDDDFVPYVWLGAEERGLAWFTGSDHHHLGQSSLGFQSLYRYGDEVILKVHLIRSKVQVDKALNYRFGLQASPTKPLRKDWRRHKVPGGHGLPVNAWGAYVCAEKYPDGHDWSIVDEIQKARTTGVVDVDFFKRKDSERVWPDMKIQLKNPWLKDVLRFAGRAKNEHKTSNRSSAVYFEEHRQYPRSIEWQVYQDEWSNEAFNRFQFWNSTRTLSAQSYRNFCLYYANEWLKRGVSLYFDNTMHTEEKNPYHLKGRKRIMNIWEHRDYYKRIWKLLMKYNHSKTSGPYLDFTGHITNTQILPYNTWMTAGLDLEQPYRTDLSRDPILNNDETKSWMSKAGGLRLPFPPDYTRAMSMGRTVGITPHIMFALTNVGDYRDQNWAHSVPYRFFVADWGMNMVHELIRPYREPQWVERWFSHKIQRGSDWLAHFGYGRDDIEVINYWDDTKALQVSSPKNVSSSNVPRSESEAATPAEWREDSVKWIALKNAKDQTMMVVLQSYELLPVEAVLRARGYRYVHRLGDQQRFDLKADGAFVQTMAKQYGTEVLMFSKEEKYLPRVVSVTKPAQVLLKEGFEFGLHLNASLSNTGEGLSLVQDEQDSNNTVLRIEPGHPSRSFYWLRPEVCQSLENYDFHFRLRLPSLPKNSSGLGLLRLSWGNERQLRYKLPEHKVEAYLDVQEGQLLFSEVQQTVASKIKPWTKSVTKSNASRSRPLLGWHDVRVEVRGSKYRLFIDGGEVLELEGYGLRGTLCLGPGWRLRSSGLPHVEVDDMVLRVVD